MCNRQKLLPSVLSSHLHQEPHLRGVRSLLRRVDEPLEFTIGNGGKRGISASSSQLVLICGMPNARTVL